MIDWLFRNRQTGELTIAQAPNVSIGIFLVARLLDWIFDPGGSIGSALRAIGTVAITWWALDELIRGVNPWRRILGGTVLAFGLFALLH